MIVLETLILLYSSWTLNTIPYDSVYLTCSKKLADSQLCPPHRTNQKYKRKTKNKLMSVISRTIVKAVE